MATPKELLNFWLGGDISTSCFLRQFFTDNLCGNSIPRKLKNRGFPVAVFIADQLPWFARKRLINFLIGREVFNDFSQTDHVIQQDQGNFQLCIKW